MSQDIVARRSRLVEAMRSNPVINLSIPGIEALLDDPDADCAFDAIDMDSIGRLETCIWMEVHAGIALRESEMLDHPCLLALAAHLATRG